MAGTTRPTPPTAFVCITGAPAVGKSAVADSVAKATGAVVFRMRSYAQTRRAVGWLTDVHNVQTNPYHWEGSPIAVERLLRDAFVYGGLPAANRVVFVDDFPRTVDELRLLGAITRHLNAPMGLVELTAADLVLMSRCHYRRICLACAPDPGGEPHVAAERSPHMPVECPACGGPLAVRGGDEVSAFIDRVVEHRQRRVSMRGAAAALETRLDVIDATADLATVCAAVRAVAADIVSGGT